MPQNLKIPESKRHKFSQPLGKLISGTRSETIPKVENYIKDYLTSGYRINVFLVGDIVSKDFLENQFLNNYIRLCIIDEKTQRNFIPMKFEGKFEEIIEFKSPKGTITKESFKLLEHIFQKKKKTLLKIIQGEEDLLVLPLVLVLPYTQNIKNLVFYGQPPITDSKHPIPEGIVMVDVNKRIQKTVQKFISIMEKK